jgi:hypothetical protein
VAEHRNPRGGSILCGVEWFPGHSCPVLDDEVIGFAAHYGSVFGKIACFTPEALCHQSGRMCAPKDFVLDADIVSLN